MTITPIAKLLDRLNISLPIIQAPMAGVSSPAMAAAAKLLANETFNGS